MDTKETKDTKVKPVLVSFVSLVAIAFLAYYWWPTPERTIKNRLRGLAETLSVPVNDGDLGRVTRVAELRHYFADDVHVRTGAARSEITSRDALLGLVGGWTPPAGGWTIEFVDMQVTVGQESTAAQVYLTAKISGHDAQTGEATLDAREANLTMSKPGSEWVVTSVESVDTLQRP
jgi:hypothetical protein